MDSRPAQTVFEEGTAVFAEADELLKCVQSNNDLPLMQVLLNLLYSFLLLLPGLAPALTR